MHSLGVSRLLLSLPDNDNESIAKRKQSWKQLLERITHLCKLIFTVYGKKTQYFGKWQAQLDFNAIKIQIAVRLLRYMSDGP